MLEELHDPVLSHPMCQVGSEPPLLSSEKFFVLGHFCYWYNVASVSFGQKQPIIGGRKPI